MIMIMIKKTKEKDSDFNAKMLKDLINNKTFILKITHTSHEVDENLITKENIDIRIGLKEILYYPKIDGEYIETEAESTKNDEEKEESTKGGEHKNKEKKLKKEFKEESSENEGEIPEKKEKTIKSAEELKEIAELTKIKKNSKILVEVKQNTSLTTLFDQIEKVINDLKIFLPKEDFLLFRIC